MKFEHLKNSGADSAGTRSKSTNMSMSLKLLIMLGFFTFIVAAVLWVIQVLMSDAVYANVKQREIDLTSEQLNESLRSESADVGDTVPELAERYNVCIKIYSVNEGEFTEEHSAIVLVNSIIANSKPENIVFYYNQAKRNGGVYRTSIALGMFDSYNPSHKPIDSEVIKNNELSIASLHAEIIDCGDDGEYLLLLNSMVTPLESAKKTIMAQFSYIIVFLLIGALCMAFLLSKLISSPLKSMNESAKLLAAGNYDVEFDVGGYREINELSDTLNYAARELSKNEGLQKELIANISHDLRTPLTMIKGYSEVMRDIPGENTPENIQAIIDETERLSSLVNDLLDLSKIESGTREFAPEPFDLTDAVESVITRYDKMKSAQGYNIEFLHDGDATVIADRTMILQVIYNLINNAINYSGDDLYVGVRQEITIDKNDQKYVRISVEDHGEGIAEDKLPLIWDRYYKIDGVHRRATVGTGIGLSIVKKLLERHNASYGVDSTLGEGSVFWFELPVDK